MATTYNVYTYRKTPYRIICCICRKELSKEEAIAFKAQRMANPKRQTNYVIVINDEQTINKFFESINAKNAQLRKIAEAHAAGMMERLDYAMQQYREGKRYTGDIVAFVNDAKVSAEVRKAILLNR